MNDNQKVFAEITGFEASYKFQSASMDYDTESREEIAELVAGTVANADINGLEIEADNIDKEKIINAIIDFHACDTGCGSDLDDIVRSL